SKDIFLHQSIAALAPLVTALGATAAAPIRGPATGPAPLAPVQRWFFDTYGPVRHFTMSTVLELPGDVEEPALRAALEAVVAHHDALRTRFDQRDGQWHQQVSLDIPSGLLSGHDLSGLTEAQQREAMVAAATEARAALD